MKSLDLPFNVELFNLTKERLASLKPVSSLDFFENVNGNLHEEGLFSTSIFGRVGDEVRSKRFSYIDIKTKIFHPVIYKRLIQLRSLYRDILAGTRFVKWDETLGDFKESNELDGFTGYAYFIEHWEKINFIRNSSEIRTKRIELIEKYKDRALVDKVLVIPAGLRDIEIDDDGRKVVSDINAIYQRILSISRTLTTTDVSLQSLVPNISRVLLQKAFNEVYENIETMLTDKNGFIQSKWGSRRIFNGTRNVITSMDTSIAELGSKHSPKFTDTIVGLYQTLKALLPVAIHQLKTGYLDYIFSPGNGVANLIDKDTLNSIQVELPSDVYDRWTTLEGLEKVITSYKDVQARNKPVIINDAYAALIYIGPDKTFRVFHDIRDLPEHLDKKNVRPISLMELLYLSGYKVWNKYPAFITRYPITGIGSVYPSTIHVKTTIVGEVRKELGSDWLELGKDYIASEFPTFEPLAYLDSLVVPSSRLKGLGAD